MPTTVKPTPIPTPDQVAALRAYAARYGRQWREKLTSAWARGADEREPEGALLRQVRNALGPAWLYKFKLPESAPTPDGAPIVGPVIVVRTVHYYGAGRTIDKARAACVQAGGARNLRSYGYTAHELPAGVCEWSVNEVDGALSWSWASEAAAPPKGSPEREARLLTDARTKLGRGEKPRGRR